MNIEYDIYRLADLTKAEGEIRKDPAAAKFTVRINGVDSLRVAVDMLELAELVRDELGASLANLDPLRLLVRTYELFSDIDLSLLPDLEDPHGGDPPIKRLVAYVQAVERLSGGVPTRGIFAPLVRVFTTRVSNAVQLFKVEALTRPQLIDELEEAVAAFNLTTRTQYIPIP